MILRIATALLALSFLTLGARAQERATLEEAQAMAEAAAAYLEEVGAEIAFPAFDDAPEWRDRDLYVFVIAEDGTGVSRGAQHELIGQNLIDLMDRNGVYFVREFLAVEDRGWVDYVYTNPINGLDEPKQSYIIQVGDYTLGVGAYVP